MAYRFNPFTGTFDYYEPAAAAATVPLSVASGTTFTVSAGTQMLAALDIRVDGDIIIDGELVFT